MTAGESGPGIAARAGGVPAGRVLVFWDYDTQWGADRSRLPGGAKSWGPLEFEHTERLLELHAEYRVPACFAVVGRAALAGARPYHDPDQIRRIFAAGHEIGSHAFMHEWLPGLSPAELKETLSASRAALEQCVGAPVTTFVPPYNQPFDFPRRLSISLSERREAGARRTGLGALCRALAGSGYRFCRVAYRPLLQRLVERVRGRRMDRPSSVESIEGVACVRLNTPGGFGDAATAMLDTVARDGGLAVVYGHPHSLSADNPQNESFLVPFLRRLATLRDTGALSVALPRDLS